MKNGNGRTDACLRASENQEVICEVTDLPAQEQEAIAEQVSPAISQAAANGRELIEPSPTASKSCNQSGTGNEKPNCYKCKYRKQLVGDAHSACGHPLASQPIVAAATMILFAYGYTEFNAGEFHIRGNTHGIRSGWFMWPMNFDPIWIEICSLFEKKDGT